MRKLNPSQVSTILVSSAALILWPFFAWSTLKWVGDVILSMAFIPQEFHVEAEPLQLLSNLFSTPSIWGFLLFFVISGLLQDQNNKKDQRKHFIF